MPTEERTSCRIRDALLLLSRTLSGLKGAGWKLRSVIMSFHLTCSVPLKATTRLFTAAFHSNHICIQGRLQPERSSHHSNSLLFPELQVHVVYWGPACNKGLPGIRTVHAYCYTIQHDTF